MLKISLHCLGLSLAISAQFTVKMCVAVQNKKNEFMKTPNFWVLKVIQGH